MVPRMEKLKRLAAAVTSFVLSAARSRQLRRWVGKAGKGLAWGAALVCGILATLQLADRLQQATPEVEVAATPPPPLVPSVGTNTHVAEEIVVFNMQSKKYHCPACHSALACTSNCVRITLAEAIKRKGIACKSCGGRCSKS